MTDYRPTSPTSAPAEPPHGQVIPEDRAKQGRQGMQMLTVLIISLVLVLVAFGALYVFRSHPATDSTPRDAAERAAGATRGT